MQWVNRTLQRIQRVDRFPEVGDYFEKSGFWYFYLGTKPESPPPAIQRRDFRVTPPRSSWHAPHAVWDVEGEFVKHVSDDWLKDIYISSRFSDSVDL